MTRERVGQALTRFRTPRERLLGVFDTEGELFTDPGFRGCAFEMASAEAPPGGAVERAAAVHREWVRTLFTTLAQDAGVAEPDALARQLHLLYDGAGLSARMTTTPPRPPRPGPLPPRCSTPPHQRNMPERAARRPVTRP